MGGKCIEAMERAHHSARTMLIDRNEEAVAIPGSASAVVIDNEEKLVIANMGGYGAVICRDGEAYQICRKNQQPFIRNWSLKFLSGIHLPYRFFLRFLVYIFGYSINFSYY